MDEINAVIRKEYGLNPDTLEEEEWLRLYAEYRILRKTELEELEITVHNALAKVLNKLFSNGNDNDTMDT